MHIAGILPVQFLKDYQKYVATLSPNLTLALRVKETGQQDFLLILLQCNLLDYFVLY